jgi:hypothetical protein
VLTTDQKGAAAELAIAHKAADLGVGVLKPLTGGERYDLIFETGSRLYRVQCKYARLHGDTVVVRCYSTRRAREGLRKRTYHADEVDLIAAYCPELDRCFVACVDQFDGRTQLDLRVRPSRNNQQRGINWADDFDFAARLKALVGP